MEASAVFAVFAHHYVSFDGPDEEGDFEALDEETGCPRLVGVFTSIRQAAEAGYTFISEHEPDEDDVYGGPIESVAVYAAPLGGKPGTGRHLASLPLTGDRTKFESALTEAFNKAGV